MELFNKFLILESEKREANEIRHAIKTINRVYNEWKKINRRKNAVNIITTSINALAPIQPNTVEKIHETSRIKLATIIMRCLDVSRWVDVNSKRKIYRRIYPLLNAVQHINPNTGTNGTLRDIVMTRLSVSITYNCDDKQGKDIFVAYEPTINAKYLRFLFGNEKPKKTYIMNALPIPEDFDVLISILKINHQKAVDKYYNNDIKKQLNLS